MRIAIIGQRDFGKGVLDLFLARGDTVAGVFCAPDSAGAATDPLAAAALDNGIATHRLTSLKTDEARRVLHTLNVDLAIMAYVLQFVPQDFIAIPRFGTIQFHPSLLPRHRGPSSINWSIIGGDTYTGLTIFRPTDGLDEGPVVLQKQTPIGPNDTLGKVYFERLFPMGIAALGEAADLVVAGGAVETVQDESQASYEGWCRAADARVNWHAPVDHVYDLIRGCDPAPGAWTQFQDKRLQMYDARKHVTRTFSQSKGALGAVIGVGERSITIASQGGEIEIFKLKSAGGKKLPAPLVCAEIGIGVGAILDGNAVTS